MSFLCAFFVRCNAIVVVMLDVWTWTTKVSQSIAIQTIGLMHIRIYSQTNLLLLAMERTTRNRRQFENVTNSLISSFRSFSHFKWSNCSTHEKQVLQLQISLYHHRICSFLLHSLLLLLYSHLKIIMCVFMKWSAGRWAFSLLLFIKERNVQCYNFAAVQMSKIIFVKVNNSINIGILSEVYVKFSHWNGRTIRIFLPWKSYSKAEIIYIPTFIPTTLKNSWSQRNACNNMQSE